MAGAAKQAGDDPCPDRAPVIMEHIVRANEQLHLTARR